MSVLLQDGEQVFDLRIIAVRRHGDGHAVGEGAEVLKPSNELGQALLILSLIHHEVDEEEAPLDELPFV